ncbi:helix-turn-helix domain-containing protein [Levilactobacillus andaensis]|uniref:helix-turn-helix domain-containing protein n=1 Tax=Levilactobacillus andaensis TaxID=2799570 RepID=UPI001941B43A|nr:helix-turn-helix transcriptional regulator [Levilactobacillus andaensis]
MSLNLGPVILQKRKAKGVTQQQLADFVGVSKASVSKWETGQSYPDITLLPLLAAFFNVSIDTLMAYSSQLTTKQIRQLYASLVAQFATRPATDVLAAIEDTIHRYYSCAPLLLEMGQLLLNHGDLLPGETAVDKLNQYLTRAQELFARVTELSTDPVLLEKARDFSAYCSLLLQRPDDVLTALGQFVPAYFPSESLIAWAYHLKGDDHRAMATTQSALYQYVTVMASQLTNYLQLVVGQPEKFRATYTRGQVFIATFDLAKLNPASVINFDVSAAMGYAQQHDSAAVHTCLTAYVNCLAAVKFPLRLHGDAYFDAIDEWLDQTDLGHALPRDEHHLQTDFVTVVLDNPVFKPYLEIVEFQPIVQRLTQIKERLNHA